MRTNQGFIQVDGWEEFQRDLRRAKHTEYPKRIGQANKKTGEFIKSLVERESDPRAVGVGRGANIRSSASKREVILRVGGAHRAGNTPYMQWGIRPGRRPYEQAPERPYVKQIADDHREEIGEFFLEAVAEAMESVFFTTEP